MPGFHVYFSNRTENLLNGLFPLLKNRKSPFQTERVAVQSRGMEKFLSLEIARAFGIAANLSFPFISHLWKPLFADVGDEEGGLPYSYPFNLLKMRIGIHEILSKNHDGFSILRNYIKSGNAEISQLKLFQISKMIAGLYDRYAVQRPEMLRKWMTGGLYTNAPDEIWQKEIFLKLLELKYAEDPLAPLEKLRRSVKIKSLDLPERYIFFGISSMPALYREILEILSESCEIHIFNLSPHEKFNPEQDEDDFTGLRSFLLRGGWDYYRYLNLSSQSKKNPGVIETGFERITGMRFIDVLKKSVNGEESEKKYSFSDEDASFSVHSCHTPLREVEALKNYLIHLFRENPDLKSSDVMVMMKDVDLYAPFIHSVFGSDTDGLQIEYSISDRHPAGEYEAWDLLSHFKKTAFGMFTAGDILSLSEHSLVKKHFRFSDEDCNVFQEWISAAKIKWGMNGKEKAEMGLPPSEENTWQRGLDSLMLGYCMQENGEYFSGRFHPVSSMDSSLFELYGRFLDFVYAVHFYADEFKKNKKFGEWHNLLLNFFRDLSGLNSDKLKLFEFLLEWDAPGHGIECGADVLFHEIGSGFTEKRYAYEFLSGGATFCSLTPMRSVPSRVIAVLGLDENSFPAAERFPSFDLIAAFPEKSDQSKKNDDKQLFLEILLSAEDFLYLSYTGKNAVSNKTIRPSSAVTLCMNEIAGRCDSGDEILNKIHVKHYLYPFHPDYFKKNADPLRKSFSLQNYKKSLALIDDSKSDPGFIPENYQKQAEIPDSEIQFSELEFFFRNPSEYFLKKLHIRHERLLPDDGDDEIFYPDNLEKYSILSVIYDFKKRFPEKSHDELIQYMKLSGMVPHENPGDVFVLMEEAGVDNLISQFKKIFPEGEEKIASHSFKTELCEIHYNETVFVQGTSVCRIKPAGLNSKVILSAWLKGLFLNQSELHTEKTILLGLKNGRLQHAVLNFPEDSKKEIENLITLFAAGICRPLPFFINSSHAYAEDYKKSGDKEHALRKAVQKWDGTESRGIQGEKEDAYIRKIFKDMELSEIDQFENTSLSVFSVIFENLEWIEGQDA